MLYVSYALRSLCSERLRSGDTVLPGPILSWRDRKRSDGLLTKIKLYGQRVKKGACGIGQASRAAVAGASDYGW